MKPFARVVLTALPVGLAAALWAVAADAQQMPPSPVRTDAVRRETLTERRRVSGNVRTADRSRVAAREAGVVTEAPVREGQRVKRGEILAKIDGARIALDLAVIAAERTTAEADLAQRRAERDRAVKDLGRLERAGQKDAAPLREVDEARAVAKVAELRVQAAEANLLVLDARSATLRRRADDCVVKAPFDGIVVARHASPGAWIGEGDAVADLLADAFEAWIDVPQKDLSVLAAGKGEIRVASDAVGRTVTVTAWRVLPDVDPKTRTFSVVASLDPASGFAPGMSLSAWVPTAETASHLTIAEDAILRNETGPYVYVAMPGAAGAPHTAMPVPVEILFHADGRAVVRADRLTEGALAVVEGNERLFPSAPVAPSNPGGAAPAPQDGKKSGEQGK
jgi:RND family efflux transporter MFP subunit